MSFWDALDVTPAQLKAFASIARHGSAKAAAVELGVTEAAISSHTAALRKELDDPLYHRAASGLAFTPGGLRLATRAVEMLGLQDQTRRDVSAARNGRRVLRLATTSLFAEFAAPGLIELFQTRADDLDVEMSVHRADELVDLLQSRRADVTITPARATSDEFRSREFLRYQLVLMVGPHHALATRRVNAQTLQAQTWLLGPSAIDPRGATAQLLHRFKVPEENQRVFQSHGAAIAEAQSGHGIAVVPQFRANDHIVNKSLVLVLAPGASAAAVWAATSLPPTQTPPVAAELMRFIITPRATQAMLSGSGAHIAHFRPSVHVTLWQ